MGTPEPDSDASFWDHLEALRGVILNGIAVVVLFSVVAFFFKDLLFDIVLAPQSSEFVSYRLLDSLLLKLGFAPLPPFGVALINTGLAQQFMLHVKVALYAGLLCSSPYLIYRCFSFISPALYRSERRRAVLLTVGGYLLFITGAAVSYFVVFPLTFQFLGTYQVAPEIPNMIDLESYISTMLFMSFCLGVVFEIPVLACLMAMIGILKPEHMTRYRRHAIVVILTVAAVITPTQDVFTLLVVSLPMWLLYELSIMLVKKAG